MVLTRMVFVACSQATASYGYLKKCTSHPVLVRSQEKKNSVDSNRVGLIWPTLSVFRQKRAQTNALLAITFQREDPGNDRG